MISVNGQVKIEVNEFWMLNVGLSGLLLTEYFTYLLLLIDLRAASVDLLRFRFRLRLGVVTLLIFLFYSAGYNVYCFTPFEIYGHFSS